MVKIVFVCLLDTGHLQIPIALGKYLLFRNPNNEIYFVVDEEHHKRIKAKCSHFKTLVFEPPERNEEEFATLRQQMFDAWMMEKNEERYLNCVKNFDGMIDMWTERQEMIMNLINQVEPDLIIVENLFDLPFIMAMKYKWALTISTNPLKISDNINYPPMGSGLIEDFKLYTDIYIEHGAVFRKRIEDWFKEFGLVRKPSLCQVQASPYFNVFLYPKMLNYFEPDDLPDKWIQLSSAIVKNEVDQFIKDQGWSNDQTCGSRDLLKEDFLKKPGKLILFSLGTLVSGEVELFKKILPVLASCPHKFIVSKGMNGDQFELPSNCVGANFLNQHELLPIVDLFITHGGNNSFTESFYYNTPMIIVPVMGDQHDNACRLETFGLGRKVLLYNISKEELCSAIDHVSGSESIKQKMKEISEMSRKDDTMDKLCDLVIETCNK